MGDLVLYSVESLVQQYMVVRDSGDLKHGGMVARLQGISYPK